MGNCRVIELSTFPSILEFVRGGVDISNATVEKRGSHWEEKVKRGKRGDKVRPPAKGKNEPSG